MMPTDPRDQPPPRRDDARTWRRYLRFFGPRAVDDLDDELRFHVEMRVRDYMARGMTEADARAETARRLGDMAMTRAECLTIATRVERRTSRNQYVDQLWQDFAFAARTLRRNPGWTAVAIITLALGIGANSAMFSVVNHLILNPLAYPSADRVVLASLQPGDAAMANVSVTPSVRLTTLWRESARSFEALEPFSSTDMMVDQRDATPRVARAVSILPTFPAFAGERPVAGRMFTEEEARTGAPVVMLAEGFWRAQYGGDTSVVGQPITLNGNPHTVVGILPAGLELPQFRAERPALWRPLNLAENGLGFWVVGRLRAGVALEDARRELDVLAKRPEIVQGLGSAYNAVLRRPAELVSFRDSLMMLTAAVALVLLIACVNVVHLVLARASSRQRELAVRAALGAGRGRLLRQLLTESTLLAAAGGAAGVALGWVALRVLIAVRPRSLAGLERAAMDGTTLAVTAGIALLTGMLFGLVGAFQASRHSTNEALKAGGPASAWRRGQGRTRSLLVVTEMALCTMLLVGAGLLIRSVVELQRKDLGFDPRGMYSLRVDLPPERYSTPTSRVEFVSRLLERVRAIPGLSAVTIASSQPGYTNYMIGALQVDGAPEPPSGSDGLIQYDAVDADYFSFMGIRIVEGTSFAPATGEAQAIVNQSMARKLYGDGSPIGRRVRIVYGGQGDWQTVVGVAADASTAGYTANASTPVLYAARGANDVLGASILVRAPSDPRLVQLLTAVPASIDKQLPPPEVLSVEDTMRSTLARPRFTMALLAIAATIAVLLAAIGLYGVLAYTVTLRTREIGIRMALGATRAVVARTVLKQGMVMAGIGAVVGVVVARKGARLLSHALYGVQESDPAAFVGAALVLVVIALLACVIPARRAVAVDPMVAIRAD